MAENTEIDLAISALEAVKLIRQTHASGPEAVARTEEVIKMLQLNDSGMGQYGSICKNVAEAISRAYLNRATS